MVVQHNLTAMNSNRMLGVTQGTVTKSTEKLSSGYKINRAADDAAGLSISEKMRRQVRGLTQASANAQDGISTVQTAEGALAEVHDMLQRMDELATKAANGTMSESDRQNVQDEISNLTTEIDRVAETTKFNETYLLKGVSKESDTKDVNLNAKSAGIQGTFAGEGNNSNVANAENKSSVDKVVFTLTNAEKAKITGLETGDTYDIGGVIYNIIDDSDTETDSSIHKDTIKTKMKEALELANGIGDTNSKAAVSGDIDSGFTITKGQITTRNALSVSLHVGADSLVDNKIDLQIDRLDSKGLGLKDLEVTGTSPQKATFAIEAIEDAINKVSSQRSTLGAVQNRLEHTIKNVDNVIENTTSAESAIRDTDMATEMVKFSNANILQQAGQSMLAQANQSNQGVLSLLG